MLESAFEAAIRAEERRELRLEDTIAGIILASDSLKVRGNGGGVGDGVDEGRGRTVIGQDGDEVFGIGEEEVFLAMAEAVNLAEDEAVEMCLEAEDEVGAGLGTSERV